MTIVKKIQNIKAVINFDMFCLTKNRENGKILLNIKEGGAEMDKQNAEKRIKLLYIHCNIYFLKNKELFA